MSDIEHIKTEFRKDERFGVGAYSIESVTLVSDDERGTLYDVFATYWSGCFYGIHVKLFDLGKGGIEIDMPDDDYLEEVYFSPEDERKLWDKQGTVTR